MGEKGPDSKDASRVAGVDPPPREVPVAVTIHRSRSPLPALCKAAGSHCFVPLIAPLSNYSPVGSGKPKPHLRLLIRLRAIYLAAQSCQPFLPRRSDLV